MGLQMTGSKWWIQLETGSLSIWLSRISEYSTTHTSDAVYIIGGKYTMEIVAEFKDNIWRQLPELFEEPGIYEHLVKMD